MFEEIVSLAIIFSFVLNIIYVDHPDTTSYTVGFLLSLAAMSPFILIWRYCYGRKRAIPEARDADAVELAPLVMGVSEMSERRSMEEAMADLEKGLGGADVES